MNNAVAAWMMRSAFGVAAFVVGCSGATLQPVHLIDASAARGLVKGELDRDNPVVQLPPGMSLDVECCAETNIIHRPVGAPLVLAFPKSDDPLEAARPTALLGEGYRIDLEHEPHILARPDMPLVRRNAGRLAGDASIALAVARAQLVALARYHEWQASKLVYTTTMAHQVDDHHWIVYFSARSTATAPNELDNVQIDVDVTTHTAIAIYAGANRSEPTIQPR